MDYLEFFERFGGSARTKHIRRASLFPSASKSRGPEKPVYRLPAKSGLPKEFIRLSPWEIEFLYLIARRAKAAILEVGRFNGGSTFLLSCAAPDVPIHSIDMAPQGDERLKRYFAEHKVGNNVNLIIGDSQHTKYDAVGPVDLLFVDGEHTYDGCMADIRNWYDNVAPNGKIVFHDSYINPKYGVQEAVLDFLDEKRDEIDVVVSPLIGPDPWRYPHGSMACLRKR